MLHCLYLHVYKKTYNGSRFSVHALFCSRAPEDHQESGDQPGRVVLREHQVCQDRPGHQVPLGRGGSQDHPGCQGYRYVWEFSSYTFSTFNCKIRRCYMQPNYFFSKHLLLWLLFWSRPIMFTCKHLTIHSICS